jgi:UDP-N-acetylmuramoylalanine--D-glutamate ligase
LSPRRALVVGLGINNRPLLPYLAARGYRVVAADRRNREDLELAGLTADAWCFGPTYLEDAAAHGPYDEVYLTPGMKKRHPVLDRLVNDGARLTCETDLFLAECPAPVMGITGSAGKTTTTTLVGDMLRRDGTRRVFVGGNIGRSLLPELTAIQRDDWVVMELSSFQLELVERSPHGAALLNLAENHLDIHGTMEAYAAAKARIFRFQGSDDWLVLPKPPPHLLMPALQQHQGRRWWFSRQEPVDAGTYVAGGHIRWRDDQADVAVLPIAEWRLPGAMNVDNALAATAIALAAGAAVDAVAEALRAFRGVPHRLEVVGEGRGLRFVNDSIATAPQRTLAALEAVSGPLVMILGGYDKHLDYRELAAAVAARARVVVLVGQVAEAIQAALPPGPEVIRADSFDDAVHRAIAAARPGDTVLLSPAAASYDMFRNFEERGERFRTLVRQWLTTSS